MKHSIYSLAMALCLPALLLAGCGSTNAGDHPSDDSSTPSGKVIRDGSKQELIVFAAASMTESLTALKSVYEQAHPEVEIVYNFDSSGTLKAQIEEGADCDLFISAGQKQMNDLDLSTRIDLLENKVALVVAPNSNLQLSDFRKLAEELQNGSLLMAMGNSDVPVGQYTQEILHYYSLSEEELAAKGCITYGSNVKEVTTQVLESAVDCGIIYATDATSAGLPIVDTATPEMCGQVIYPAAVLATAKHPEAAEQFLNFLTEEDASNCFREIGFSPVR